MRILALLLVGTLVFGPLTACGESEEAKQVQEGLSQTWDGVKSWTVKKRDEAQVFFEKNLDGLDEKLAAAKGKAAGAGDEASKELQAAWDDAARKLKDLNDAGQDGWTKARDEFVKAYEKLKQELDELGDS